MASSNNRRAKNQDESNLPHVSVIVAAFNEEKDLPRKLQNLQELDYPADRMQVVIVSDGSTDSTNEILHRVTSSNIEAVILSENQGKANALNCGVARAQHKILILTDTSTVFYRDSVRKLVRHFCDPSVGTVCGTVQLVGSDESRNTEGTYWKYDQALRLMEGRLGATIVATGAIYATRRQCFVPLDPSTILDDLIIPMNTRRAGLRIVHDPEAVAKEFSAESVANEFTRRVRLAVGSFRALSSLMTLRLDLVSAWALFSHKLLRWIVPFLLAGLLGSSALLGASAVNGNAIYRGALLLQVAFYLWAGLGYLFRSRLRNVRFALVGYFLLTMHLAFAVGLYRYLFRDQRASWERVA
jgi:cellulose synthase/poly-beta-1,6-N-acetylglucosamine synthase-like glycosyltransferase